jgi:uncharacterized protein YhfF
VRGESLTVRGWGAFPGGELRLGGLEIVKFEDPGPVRDQVVAAILAGAKTTTTGLVLEFPEPGQQYVVLDSVSRPAAVIEMTEVRKVPIADINLRHVIADGDESVAE